MYQMGRRGKIYPYALTQRRRRWWRKLLLWLFLPALLISLELLLRLAGGWLGLDQLTGDRTAYAYSLSTYNNGLSLQVQYHGSLGYVLSPQKSDFWQINQQGLRADRPIPAQPVRGITRLFLLGNSTAFGYGAENNSSTLAALIEQALNRQVARQKQTLSERGKPIVRDTQFQVINCAVPGYASGNQVTLLAHQIINLRPAGIILLGGYEDLRLPSSQAIAEIAPIQQILNDPSAYTFRQMFHGWGQWFSSLYIARLTRKLQGFSPVLPPPLSSYQVFDDGAFSSDPSEIQARVQRLHQNWRKMALWGIPMLLVLQPEITAHPEQLAKLPSLSPTYRERLAQNMPYWRKLDLAPLPRNVKFVDMSGIFSHYPDLAFRDPIHLTPSGNQFLAQAIASQVLSLFPPETPKSE
jgi:hypothetical protein